MDKLLDFPVSHRDYKLNSKDFAAGASNAKDDIEQRGLETAVRYFNSKVPYISKYSGASVISYWGGFQGTLANAIKELEHAN